MVQFSRETSDIDEPARRHHAKRAEAAGFCYVADAVLAIMELRTPTPKPSSPTSPDLDTTPPPPDPPQPPSSRISRVMYLDLDLHHGDGVESAFFSSPHVLTLSMHLFAPLFFPSTGALESTGPKGARAPAAGHALNLALEPGLGEGTFERVWGSCVEKVVGVYEPDAIVVQLGVDGLAGDPCKVRRHALVTRRPFKALTRAFTAPRSGTFPSLALALRSSVCSVGTSGPCCSAEEATTARMPLAPGPISLPSRSVPRPFSR